MMGAEYALILIGLVLAIGIAGLAFCRDRRLDNLQRHYDRIDGEER